MNTKSLLTRIGVPVLSLGLLGGLGATLATSASAAVKPPTATVVASTHAAGLPDTTVGDTGFYEDGTGHITKDLTKSVYGPVWAIDDLKETYKVTPLGGNQYEVDRMVNGTFQAFAQPNSGQVPAPAFSSEVDGQVHGTISYVVTSVAGPVGNLPADEPTVSPGSPPSGSHLQLKQLFPDASNIAGGNDWVFAYHAAHGSMTQRYDTDSSTWGNITG